MLWNVLSNVMMVAASMAGCVVFAARRANGRVPGWVAGVVFVGAVGAASAATWNVTTCGFHGQMHWAFSLATERPRLVGGAVEDPVFAGRPLMYPWTAHWVYARVARALHATPAEVIAASDVLWLGIMVLATGWGAALLVGDRDVRERRGAAIVAGFLAWTGVMVTDDRYVALVWRLHPISTCTRMVPAEKFFDPNNNPIGLALSAVAVLCLLGVMMGTRRVWLWAIVLAVAALGCALMYPISYVGMVAIVVGGAIGTAVARRTLFDMRMILGGAAVAIGGVCALPQMQAFDAGRQAGAQIAVTAAQEIAEKLGVLGTVAWPAVVLVVLACRGRRRTPDDGERVRASRGMLIGAAAALGGLYVALTVPLACEYKFLAQTAVPIACLLGPWVAGLARGRWWAAMLVLTLLALAGADRELQRFDMDRPVRVALHADRLHARDRNVDEMLTFLREHTAPDAVVLADEPLVATLADRAVYLPSALVGNGADGWSMKRYVIAKMVVGHSSRELQKRVRLQTPLLAGKSTLAAREAAETLGAEFPGREVYAVVASADIAAKLVESGRWASAYANGAESVVQLRR